jgi:hypothetical protein
LVPVPPIQKSGIGIRSCQDSGDAFASGAEELVAADVFSVAEMVGEVSMGNWTMFFEKKRSSIQSSATRTFFGKAGKFAQVDPAP